MARGAPGSKRYHPRSRHRARIGCAGFDCSHLRKQRPSIKQPVDVVIAQQFVEHVRLLASNDFEPARKHLVPGA